MEDAHLVHMQDDSAFFGVFDGHGGHACSEFVAGSLEKHLEEHGLPANDAAVEALMLRVDQDFLETSSSKSGSTGTFVIIEPMRNASKRCLRVGNIGDSRVLLGRSDGSMVRGTGTDFGLTVDHKPDSPSELERIVATGNNVICKKGLPRINGSLAVSRAFGDVKYKLPRDSPPGEQCVCAKPDLYRMQCDQSDFVMLVCDGISEGTFPNADVVSLAAEELRYHGDPGRAATAVCRKALMERSTDNLTCMIVLLSGSPDFQPRDEFLRGPVSSFHDMDFMNAYMNHYYAAKVVCPFMELLRYKYICFCLQQTRMTPNSEQQERILFLSQSLDNHVPSQIVPHRLQASPVACDLFAKASLEKTLGNSMLGITV